MRIDVYDFDHTIYDGDTIVDFWRFEVARHPALLRFLPRQLFALLMRGLKRRSTEQAKSGWQCYFAAIDLDAEAAAFWVSRGAQKKLFAYYQTRPSDLPRVWVSASARRVLLPLAGVLPVDAILGTEADDHGRLTSLNCRHQVKVDVLQKHFPEFSIRAMYTDDVISDAPLLALAQERYLVTKGKLTRIGD